MELEKDLGNWSCLEKVYHVLSAWLGLLPIEEEIPD